MAEPAHREDGNAFGGTPVLVRKWLYKDGLNPIYEEAWDSVTSTWVQTRFVYASRTNAPDFLIRGGVTYRVVSDHLGSPRLIIDTASGNVAQALEYDEWGQILSDTLYRFHSPSSVQFCGWLTRCRYQAHPFRRTRLRSRNRQMDRQGSITVCWRWAEPVRVRAE